MIKRPIRRWPVLLTLLGLSIRVHSSRHLIKLALLIYSFVVFALWNTSLPHLLQGLLLLSLCLHGYWLWSSPPSCFSCQQLSYQGRQWYLKDQNGDEMQYQKIRILLETGLFFLVEFEGLGPKKK